MKKRKVAMVLGILFGICLFPVAYLTLVLGIALAFAGNHWFAYFGYVFGVFALACIIGSCFAKKKPLVTLIVNALASVVLLGINGYLASVGLLFSNIGFFVFYAFVDVLGLLSTFFAGRAYHKQLFKGEDVK